MDEEKIFLRDDINFLENPNWVVSQREFPDKLVIVKETGYFEIKGSEGLPVRFDKIILYYLLHILFKKSNFKSREIVTTRYEIAKNVSASKSFGKGDYDRIMLALKRWSAIHIKFEGIFYQGDNHTVRYFHIIDSVKLDKKTKELTIGFNSDYIRQLQETKFYKLINFHEYKKLTRPVSARLYEILVKNFKDRSNWSIDILKLAEKLTLGKRTYPSQVIVALKPAISEINKKTELKIDFNYDSKTFICNFKQISKKQIEKDQKIQPAQLDKYEDPNVELLIKYGITKLKSKTLLEKYTIEKIEEKISLLKQQDTSIKNTGAWLSKALDEDWQEKEYNKKIELKKEKEVVVKKRELEEKKKKELEKLKSEFIKIKENKIHEIYKNLPEPLQENLDEQFKNWFNEQKKIMKFALPEEIFKTNFLIKMLTKEKENEFEDWLKLNQKNIITKEI